MHNCTGCRKGINRSLIRSGCGCKDGHYDDGSNINCIACKYPCGNCKTRSTSCTSCRTTANRVSATDCSCKPGSYETGSSCQLCQYPCRTCKGLGSGNCLSCASTIDKRSSTSTCNCIGHYYETKVLNTGCAICNYKCKDCD